MVRPRMVFGLEAVPFTTRKEAALELAELKMLNESVTKIDKIKINV